MPTVVDTATYRTVIPMPDAHFYGQAENTWRFERSASARPQTMTYIPVDECIEKIREVAHPKMDRQAGTITIDFEVGPDGIENTYELGRAVSDLEDELNAYQYFTTPLQIPAPTLVAN